jgi:hypothetical protein
MLAAAAASTAFNIEGRPVIDPDSVFEMCAYDKPSSGGYFNVGEA